MLSEQYLQGFRSAVRAYGMNAPRGAYDARLRRFTPRRRASDQLDNQAQSDGNRPLPAELMRQLRAQLHPDTYQMLKAALIGGADDQDPDQEDDNSGLSPPLIEKICELVGPHLSDSDFEQFQALLDGTSAKEANDQPPAFSGKPRPGGGSDPVTAASRARPSAKSPAADARPRRLLPSSLQSYEARFPDAARLKMV